MLKQEEPIVTTIRLAKPAQRSLANAGIITLTQLSKYTEKQIGALHGIGKNALEQLKVKLQETGKCFKPE